VNHSFYKELELVDDKFPKYHMKTMLGDFLVKLCKEDVFKPTTAIESIHKVSNDNGVRVINFAYLKISQPKVRYSNIVTVINLLGLILLEEPTIRLTAY
jgi:hypothetical protein